MGVAHSAPRRVAVCTEGTFAAGPDTDWSTDGNLFYCIEPDVSGVAQGSVDNENYRPRPAPIHSRILALKSEGTFSFSQYLTASGSTAAEQASASTTQLAENIRCAIGGRDLGYCCGVASATSAALTVDTGEGSNFEQGDWVLLSVDGTTYFHRVESVSTDTLTLDRNVTGTVDASDRTYAVIDCFWDQDALTKSTDGNYITRAFLFEGEDAEDNYDLRGCKLSMSIEPFEAGQAPRISFEGMHTTFLHETLSAESLSGSYEGEAPLAIGTGSDTTVYMADVGSSLAEVVAHSFTPQVGISWEKVTGPNGTEGVHGYIATGFDSCGLQMSLRYDDDYATAWRAGTKKHVLIQVGTGSKAIGLYFPNLELSEEPKRGSGPGNVLVSELTFKALENTASAGSLTGDSLQKWLSPMHVLIPA